MVAALCLNDPRGEFCLAFAVPQSVAEQRPAPGRHSNNTCDLMECKQRAEEEGMGDDRNGLRGGQGGRVEVARDAQGSSVFSAFSPTILMYSVIDEGEAVSRSVHLIGFNDVRAKPSVLSAGLMRAGSERTAHTRARRGQSGDRREVLL